MASNSEIAQKSFNPSWMTASPLKMPKPNGTHRNSNDEDDNSASLEMMEPIFARHRYGREDILALIPKDAKGPPDGLQNCPYFLEKPSTPIILTNLNDTEQRIQHNINSSKALSAAHRNEWPSKDTEVSGSNSPQAANPWTIAGSSRTNTSFRTGNNRWTAPNNAGEGARTTKPYSGFGRQGFGVGGANNPEKPRLAKAAWAESNDGNGFKPRQHLKSTGEDSSTRTDETEQPKVPSSNAWGVGWRAVENKLSDRQKPGELNKPSATFNRIPNADNSKNEQTTKENIWSAPAMHNNSIWTPPASLHNAANETEKPAPIIAHSSSSSLEQQKSIEAEMNVQRAKISPTRANPTEFLEQKPDQWFYLDPQNIKRGPFSGDQMQAWFLNGYFQQDLKIMQPADTSYTPLGELIKLNGALTPFYNTKAQNPSPIGTGSTISSNTSTHLPWAQGAAIQRPQAQEEPKNSFGNASAELSLESLKLLEVKERMIAEKQRQLEEQEEILRKQEQEKSSALLKMQMELERQRQDIEKRAKEQERQAELHRIQILEYENQQRKKLEQLEAEQQLKLQQENLIRRQQAAAEAQKLEEERQRAILQAELKQKEERRRQELLELQRQQELKRKEEAERLAAAAQLREQQEQLIAYQRQQKLLQEQQMAQKAALAASKAAPWSSTNQSSKATEFRAIQEQERLELLTMKMLEEEKRKELDAEQKRVASTTQGNGNPWNVVKTAKPVPIPPAKESNQPQPKAPKAQKAQTAKAPPKPQPVKETKVEDPLTAWVIQSIKKISTGVDPEVFATFLQGIESPNEVEDYIYTYFGETKKAKDFHQEFLAKRIELRPRRGKKDDDLSAPARSATDLPSSSAGKKAKKVKKVVDISTMMNFRPAGDSNRFNVGEIDTEIPAASKKGKKK